MNDRLLEFSLGNLLYLGKWKRFTTIQPMGQAFLLELEEIGLKVVPIEGIPSPSQVHD